MPAPRRGHFTQTSGFLKAAIRRVSETRGFAQTRLLTNWEDIAGLDMAKRATPVKVSFAKSGLGATLTLLCKGADAPMLEMELPKLKERVNATYGYKAISEIKLTQTAEIGFAEDQAPFFAPSRSIRKVDGETHAIIDSVEDENLQAALTRLSANLTGTNDKDA
ncbi:MAG: DciA family protein [Pseudomonadota bacterium]